MTEDYDDILDRNVDEVKKAVRELENPDYRELLQLEEEGKDRKAIKDFLEKRESEEEVEIAEEIEEETAGGFLGDFSREKVLAGGVVAGVVIGLLVGLAFTGQGSSGSEAEIESSLQQFYDISGNSPDSISVTERSGMFYAQVNISQETENGTQTSSQNFYVSPNGELLFPEISSPLMTNPYNLNDLIARAQAQQRQPTANTTGNTTQ
jgi:hypothetical protein